MPRRIIDPDESDDGAEEEEVAAAPARSRGRPSRRTNSRASNAVEEEEVAATSSRSRGRGRSRTSNALPSRAARLIETIDEEDEDEAAERPAARGRRRRDSFVVEDEEEPAQRPASRSRRRRGTAEEDADETIVEKTPKGKESLSDATLAVLTFSDGPIKEADLKPLLVRGRYKDWEVALNDLNETLSTAFGITIVYDGIAKQFFVRNDLKDIKTQLSEMFDLGALKTVRIDDGTRSAAEAPLMTERTEFSAKDKKGLLFTVLSTIMMANNIDLGHKQWCVEEEVLKHMCCESMDVPTEVFEKLLSSKHAEFIKDGWIRKSEEQVGDGNELCHYYWGPRAIATVSTLKIFEKFCLVNKNKKLEWGNYEERLKKLDEKNDLYHARSQQE